MSETEAKKIAEKIGEPWIEDPKQPEVAFCLGAIDAGMPSVDALCATMRILLKDKEELLVLAGKLAAR
jgi:hypothetical protein